MDPRTESGGDGFEWVPGSSQNPPPVIPDKRRPVQPVCPRFRSAARSGIQFLAAMRVARHNWIPAEACPRAGGHGNDDFWVCARLSKLPRRRESISGFATSCDGSRITCHTCGVHGPGIRVFSWRYCVSRHPGQAAARTAGQPVVSIRRAIRDPVLYRRTVWHVTYGFPPSRE